MPIEDQTSRAFEEGRSAVCRRATAGERYAAGAAAQRLRAKLEEAARRDRPIEMKFTMPDAWSVRLFIALCRRYGFKPFRYSRSASHDGDGRWRRGRPSRTWSGASSTISMPTFRRISIRRRSA